MTKAIINGYAVEAKPEDLALILTAKQPKKVPVQAPQQQEPTEGDDIRHTVEQSKKIREQLENNGRVDNPYPGVVGSKEPSIPDAMFNNNYAAEQDTGVAYDV